MSYGTRAESCLKTLVDSVKDKDPLAPVTVIVTSQYVGLSLRRSLGSDKGLINVRFMVLPRLAEYLASASMSANDRHPIHPLYELAAVQQTANPFRGNAPLGEIVDNPKLHQSLLSTFSELGHLSPEGIKKVAEHDSLRWQIVEWYRQVKEVTRGYYSREALCRQAARAFRENPNHSALKDLGFIVLYLVPDFAPAEEELVSALYQAGAAAVVFGTTGDRDVDGSIERLVRRLEPAFQIQDTSSPPPDRHVEHILIAHNYQEEVKWIVRQALVQAEEGVPFHRMAVLYHDAFPYAEFIEQQFANTGAPVSGPSKELIKDTPPGKLVTGLLEVIESDLSRDVLMKWIAESPVRAVPGSKPAGDELARWEAISQNAGVLKGADEWRRGLANHRDNVSRRIAAQDDSEEDASLAVGGLREELSSLNILLNLVNRLADLKAPGNGSSYKSFADWIKTNVREFAFDPDDWPEAGQNSYKKIEEILEEIGSLDRLLPRGTTLEGFVNLLGIAFDTSVGRIGRTGEGIFVAPVGSVAGMNFEVVFITGMSEGAFPPRPPIDAMLPDAVRLSVVDTDRLPLSSERAINERRDYLAAIAAGRKCFLSFCWTDPSAERGQYPSPWLLDEIAKLNGKAVGSAEINGLANKPWLSIVYSAEHALGAKGFQPADLHDYDMASLSLWRAGHHRMRGHFLLADATPAGRALNTEEAHRGADFSVWDGNLASIARKSLSMRLPGNEHFSPTRLERWARCPMSYFFGYVLGIPVYDKPEEILTISALDRGSLVHHILERFFSTLMERKDLPDHGEAWSTTHRNLLLDIARQEFTKTREQGITGRPLMWQMVQEEIEQELVSFLDADNGLRGENGLKTIHVERAFGFGREGNLSPVVVKIGTREIRLHGLIDRVDSSASGDQVYVIDYKTGGTYSYYGMKKNPLDHGKHLQLPVYSMAVRGSLQKPANIRACYWFISTKGNFERREVDLSAVEPEFNQDLQIIASGIEDGLYPANPGGDEKDNCGYCDYERICAADRDLMWKKKRDAPELKSYLKLIGEALDEEESE